MCRFEGCGKEKYAKLLCRGHYRQLRLGEALRPLGGPRTSKARIRDSQGRKLCPTCLEWKDTKVFGKFHQQPDGLQFECKPCQKIRRAVSKYRISAFAYEAMMANGCAICGSEDEALDIDHDHACCPGVKSCGRCVRGALCRSCNTAIGSMKDDVERLQSAIDYLKRSTYVAR